MFGNIVVLVLQALFIQNVFTQNINYAPIEGPMPIPGYLPGSGLLPPGLVGPGLPPGLVPILPASGLIGPGFPGPGLVSPGFNPYNLPPYGFNGFPMGPYPYGGFDGPIEYPIYGDFTPGMPLIENFEGPLNYEYVGDFPYAPNVIDGVIPYGGLGAVNFGCGSGLNVMTNFGDYQGPGIAALPSMYPAALPPNAMLPIPAQIPNAMLPSPAPMPDAILPIPTTISPAPIAIPVPYSSPTVSFASPIQPYIDSTVPCNIAINSFEFTATSGGAFPVFSSSTTTPVGLTLTADIGYEGPLTVSGAMPFMGTAAVDGALPVAGIGAVNHACGNGKNSMVSQEMSLTVPAAVGPWWTSD